MVIAGNPLLIAVAAAGLVLAVASRRGGVPGAVLAALSVGCSMNALARAQLDVDFGVTAAVSIGVCAVVLVAGLSRCSRVVRRSAYGVIAALGAFAVVSTAMFGLAAMRARHDLADGVRTAEQAVAALEHGDYEEAAVQFSQSAAALERAHAEVSSPWAIGAGFVPIVAQHYDAAVDMSATGASGAAVVADALDDIDPESLQVERGRVDLAAVAALAGPLGGRSERSRISMSPSRSRTRRG